MNGGSRSDNDNGPAAGAGHPVYSPWVITFTVMLSTFMLVLDTSIANVALPHIAGNLSATVDQSTWVLTSFIVANAIVLPLAGWFSQLFGRKRFYITCVFLFTMSSFLCGLAPSLTSLILFRILQGASGGAMQPLAQSMLVESFPQEKRGMAMAVYGMGVVVAPVIGPTLGGWLTDSYSWRWIFFINIPTGILSITLASIVLRDPPHLKRRSSLKSLHLDLIGLFFMSLGIGALQIILDKGERDDWFASHFIIVLSAISIISLIIAVLWELHMNEPVVNLHLFKERQFAITTGLMFIVGFGLYGSTVLLPLFLQILMGYTAFNAGLVLSPGGIVTMMAMPFVGFMVGKVGAKWLITTGLIIGAIGLYEMSRFDLNVSFSHAVWSRVILSASLAFLFVPINTVAYSRLSKEVYDQAAGLINLSRYLGASFGISAVTTILARRAQFHQNMLSSHTTEFNPIFRQLIERITEGLIYSGQNAYTAAIQSKAILYRILQQQALTLSYVDAFWLLAVMFLAVVPLTFFLKGK
jgi:DHA2 family multidrug resistance protein